MIKQYKFSLILLTVFFILPFTTVEIAQLNTTKKLVQGESANFVYTGTAEGSSVTATEKIFCTPKPPDDCEPHAAMARSAHQMKEKGIHHLSKLGLIFLPQQNTLMHKLAFQILNSSGTVLFTTSLDCVGCDQNYLPVAPPMTGVAGHLFRLNSEAVTMGQPYYEEGNYIRVLMGVHNGSYVTLAYVKLDS
jgi:hypothetical protein